MLSPDTPVPALSELDQQVFALIVPQDHYLRQVKEKIDFERFRARLVAAYSPTMGRPPIDPIRMLRVLFLRYHYRLPSDRVVMERAQTDMSFRWFLDLRSDDKVPDHTSCTRFRNRIGTDTFMQVFQDLVAMGRELGLVRDRLRLKDATHLFAAVADVQPLQLAAQVRERLLQAALPVLPDWVRQQRVQIETLRQTTAELPDEERLQHRVTHLQEMATQLQARLTELPPAAASANQRQYLDRALAVVAKLLQDHADPKAGDRLASAIDPEARTGKHGEFFVGYLLDVAMDADSEIITAINVLPGNGAEAADAVTLIQQEETAHGNDVAAISMDGVGFNGPVLRELTDPADLHLDVTVPPPEVYQRKTFMPERFTLTVINDQVGELTCPNGQTTRQRERNENDTGYKYTFKKKDCDACPLRQECLANPQSKGGRTVIKNDYEAEYKQVFAKAKTPEYEATRRTHPKIERKLGEIVRHHGARQANYRGQAKVLMQALLTGLVVNVKRMVKLVAGLVPPATGTLAVRAELTGT